MKHTANNLLLFRKYFNNLYHQLRNQERDISQYELEEAHNGMANLCVIRDGNRTTLHSTYNPINEAERWVNGKATEIKDATDVLVYGFGLGYHLEAFIKSFPGKRLYIFEPNMEILLAALELRDLSKILKHPNITVFGFGSAMEAVINLILNQMTTSFLMLVPPSYERAYKLELAEFNRIFHEKTTLTRSNLATTVSFYEQWPENILLNISNNLKSAPLSFLRDKLKGYPAVIVGSGPSFDLELDNIKRIRNSGLLFAAGSSIQALLKNGIEPDLIGAIDGSEKFADAFRDLKYEHIPMLYTPIVIPKVINSATKGTFHCSIHTEKITGQIMQNVADIPILNSTFSVTGLLIQAAIYMGCEPIIFVGQDLSYPNKQYYANTVTHFSNSEIQDSQLYMDEQIKNTNGGMNPTSKVMLNTLRDIEMLIRTYGGESSFINCSRNGAVIKGTEYVPMSAVCDQLADESFDRKQYNQILDYGRSYYSLEQKERVLQGLEKMKLELEQANKEISELFSLIGQFQRGSHLQINKWLVEIEHTWRKLSSSSIFENLYNFVIQAQIYVYTRHIPEIVGEQDEFRKAELIVKHMGSLVIYMADVTPKLIMYLKQAIEQIQEDHMIGSNQ